MAANNRYTEEAAGRERTPADMYARAAEVMNAAKTEVAFRAAATMFGLISDYRDAGAMAEKCLFQAEVCRKDAIYDSAAAHMAEGSVFACRKAIALLQSIPGWRDADELLPAYREQLEREKTKSEEARRQREKEWLAAEKKRGRRRSLILALAVFAALGCITFVILHYAVILPARQYGEAAALFEEGSYERAKAAFESLNGYKDSAERARACEEAIAEPNYFAAVKLYESGRYEEAITAFSYLNGYKDSAEYISKSHQILLARVFEEQKAGLKDADVGSVVKFGLYDQFDILGSGQEEIEWLVLEKKDGRLLVISVYALDGQFFEEAGGEATWEKSYIRTWLNETFAKEAFGPEHLKMIADTVVTADANPNSAASPGGDTVDKVFLLSAREAGRYFGSNEERRCTPTQHAITYGAKESTVFLSKGKAVCWWWLRTPGADARRAARVRTDGSIDYEGTVAYLLFNAVRPAVWIDAGA